MAPIAPFRAFRYDPAQVALSRTVTQPYDKITAEMQEHYYAASPYNLVRIILGKREAADHAGNSVYTRAAASFRDWRRQGVLRQDAEPCIYLYTQRFSAPGSGADLERRGFIALGRLEDYSAGVVFRHEQTLSKPKADRLDLLRATRAHFGQLFMLYSDPSRQIDSLLTTGAAADLEVTDEYGVSHRVWKISDPAAIEKVTQLMSDKKLLIADGHHRYETALTYRDERRAQTAAASAGGASGTRAASPGVDSDAPYESVMMTFVNMDSPGLVILPTHRVVHGLHDFSSHDLRDGARALFRVEEIDPAFDGAHAGAILRDAGRGGTALLAATANRA